MSLVWAPGPEYSLESNLEGCLEESPLDSLVECRVY